MKAKLCIIALLLISFLFVQSVTAQTRVPASPAGGNYGVPVVNERPPSSEIVVYTDSMQILLKNPPPLNVMPISTVIDGSEKPGLQIPVYSGDMVEVSKSWKKFIKSQVRKRTKFQSSPSGDYYFTDDAYIPQFSANTLDIYAEFQPFEEEEGVYLNVFYDLGGAFLSPEDHPEKYLEASTMLQQFASVESIKATEVMLLLEEEELLLLKAERDELKNKGDQIQFEIDEYRAAMEKAQGALDANNELLDQKNEETKDQIGIVEQLKLNLRSFSAF